MNKRVQTIEFVKKFESVELIDGSTPREKYFGIIEKLESGKKLTFEDIDKIKEMLLDIDFAVRKLEDYPNLHRFVFNKIRIVTHAGMPHLDDLIAVSLCTYIESSKHGEEAIVVERVNHVDEFDLLDKNTIVIDIGGEFNPEFGNFDHHHDKDIECSLLLLLKHQYSELWNDISLDKKLVETFEKIDKQDRGIERVESLDIFEGMLKSMYLDEQYYMIGKYLFDYINQKIERIKVVGKTKIVKIGNLKVGFNFDPKASVAMIASMLNVDLIVTRNREPDCSQITKNSLKEVNVDLSKLDAKFVHPAGFMAVVRVDPVEDNIDKFVEMIKSISKE